MKTVSLLLVGAGIVLSGVAHAFSVNSRYTTNAAGAYVKEIQVLCDANEGEYCQVLCKQEKECRRVEPYCLNCAGTASSVMRSLFTQISQNYIPTQNEIPVSSLVKYMVTTSYILIGAKSVYNYYKPLNSGEFLSNLQALCPSETEDPLLAIKLTSEQQPEKLSFILCKDTNGTSRAYDVALRSPVVGGTPVFDVKMNLNLKLK
ncbi:hypothetical protein [Bdellovibrio sp. NC01]|uniref:hypothetical protein n=1 Tax=Bdellovibrio sp. NC01 TaxID=2220073 RepID=UPI00115961D7|nr:hypothetical protein [Bdellovibrio sp. NC01]QDK37257.1 hypothetical protein DOE51_06460 [Bdellovibrio sp. NC01]